jgi:hypothetical protein
MSEALSGNRSVYPSALMEESAVLGGPPPRCAARLGLVVPDSGPGPAPCALPARKAPTSLRQEAAQQLPRAARAVAEAARRALRGRLPGVDGDCIEQQQLREAPMSHGQRAAVDRETDRLRRRGRGRAQAGTGAGTGARRRGRREREVERGRACVLSVRAARARLLGRGAAAGGPARCGGTRRGTP